MNGTVGAGLDTSRSQHVCLPSRPSLCACVRVCARVTPSPRCAPPVGAQKDTVISGNIHNHGAWITGFFEDIRVHLPKPAGMCPPDRPVVGAAAVQRGDTRWSLGVSVCPA
jgi:hypothetical protein